MHDFLVDFDADQTILARDLRRDWRYDAHISENLQILYTSETKVERNEYSENMALVRFDEETFLQKVR